MKQKLTAIILTYNEEKNVQRCIDSIKPVTDKIIVVDSFSNDKTVDLVAACGVPIVQHFFVSQSQQFQWALDNFEIYTDWVLRLDADEYLDPVLQKELVEKIPNLPENIIGIYTKRKVFFQGRWIRYGGFYPQTLLRIWRSGQGRLEQRWMDEHVVLPSSAKTITLKGHIVDDNLKGITFWINKHNQYASREMTDFFINKYFPMQRDHALYEMRADQQARIKRILKNSFYSKLPLGFRAGLYFFYRYILKLGFLDGSKGFIWHFLQGFWYRLLVDIKILEVESKSNGDPQKIKNILSDEYGIDL